VDRFQADTQATMRRRIQMFVSVVLFFGSLAAAAAISNVRYASYSSGAMYEPQWVKWLAVGVLILGIASPILTWPRPVIMWRRRGDTKV
jgi:formate-dependent nitrite reductase membrane component NrfD